MTGELGVAISPRLDEVVLEKLELHLKDERGRMPSYGKVAVAVVTGNEDGVKHCATGILYGMQHLGFVIPPQADAGWIGEVGPGPSYLDEGSGGPENEFTVDLQHLPANVYFLKFNTNRGILIEKLIKQ